jgi:NaMN:DMB phosphoribosyltransferase
MDMLRRLGGRELVAMAGAIVAARMRRVPVLLDGYVCGAAAAALAHAAPGALITPSLPTYPRNPAISGCWMRSV